MTYRAIGRLAVVALTGTFLFAAVPAFAACSNVTCTDTSGPVVLKKYAKQRVRIAHRRQRDDSDVASSEKSSTKSQAKVEAKPDPKSAALPTDVADARAQMTADDAKAKPATADMPAAQPAAAQVAPAPQDPPVQVVSADELNDLDKAATDGSEPLPKLSPAIANARAEMRDQASPWAQTSTIGKAFIAFGVMLTLASAARMFMA